MIDQIKWALDNFGKLTDQRGRKVSWKQPPICVGCGKNRSDPPSPLCVGCQAYQEHQQ